jgi:hypothetical protein
MMCAARRWGAGPVRFRADASRHATRHILSKKILSLPVLDYWTLPVKLKLSCLDRSWSSSQRWLVTELSRISFAGTDDALGLT